MLAGRAHRLLDVLHDRIQRPVRRLDAPPQPLPPGAQQRVHRAVQREVGRLEREPQLLTVDNGVLAGRAHRLLDVLDDPIQRDVRRLQRLPELFRGGELLRRGRHGRGDPPHRFVVKQAPRQTLGRLVGPLAALTPRALPQFPLQLLLHHHKPLPRVLVAQRLPLQQHVGDAERVDGRATGQVGPRAAQDLPLQRGPVALAGRDEPAGVGAEADLHDVSGVAGVRVVGGVLEDARPVVYLDLARVVPDRHDVPVRVPVHRVDVGRVWLGGPDAHDGEPESQSPAGPLEVARVLHQQPAGPHVEEQDLVRVAAGLDHGAILAEVDARDGAAVARAPRRPLVAVPRCQQVDGHLGAPRRQHPAVRAVLQDPDGLPRVPPLGGELPGPEVKHRNRAPRQARGDVPAVRREGQRGDPALEPERVQLAVPLGVPQQDLAEVRPRREQVRPGAREGRAAHLAEVALRHHPQPALAQRDAGRRHAGLAPPARVPRRAQHLRLPDVAAPGPQRRLPLAAGPRDEVERRDGRRRLARRGRQLEEVRADARDPGAQLLRRGRAREVVEPHPPVPAGRDERHAGVGLVHVQLHAAHAEAAGGARVHSDRPHHAPVPPKVHLPGRVARRHEAERQERRAVHVLRRGRAPLRPLRRPPAVAPPPEPDVLRAEGHELVLAAAGRPVPQHAPNVPRRALDAAAPAQPPLVPPAPHVHGVVVVRHDRRELVPEPAEADRQDGPVPGLVRDPRPLRPQRGLPHAGIQRVAHLPARRQVPPVVLRKARDVVVVAHEEGLGRPRLLLPRRPREDAQGGAREHHRAGLGEAHVVPLDPAVVPVAVLQAQVGAGLLRRRDGGRRVERPRAEERRAAGRRQELARRDGALPERRRPGLDRQRLSEVPRLPQHAVDKRLQLQDQHAPPCGPVLGQQPRCLGVRHGRPEVAWAPGRILPLAHQPPRLLELVPRRRRELRRRLLLPPGRRRGLRREPRDVVQGGCGRWPAGALGRAGPDQPAPHQLLLEPRALQRPLPPPAPLLRGREPGRLVARLDEREVEARREPRPGRPRRPVPAEREEPRVPQEHLVRRGARGRPGPPPAPEPGRDVNRQAPRAALHAPQRPAERPQQRQAARLVQPAVRPGPLPQAENQLRRAPGPDLPGRQRQRPPQRARAARLGARELPPGVPRARRPPRRPRARRRGRRARPDRREGPARREAPRPPLGPQPDPHNFQAFHALTEGGAPGRGGRFCLFSLGKSLGRLAWEEGVRGGGAGLGSAWSGPHPAEPDNDLD